MKKNLLFVNPWIYDFAAYDMWMKPLGLLYLISYFDNAGYNTEFIDCLDRSEKGISEKEGQYGSRKPA